MKTTCTNSIPAAAYACAQGHPLPRFEEYKPGRYQMIFDVDPDEEASRAISDYFNGAVVTANDFYHALQDIRAALNAAKGGVR